MKNKFDIDVIWDIIKTIVGLIAMGAIIFYATHRDIIELQAEARELKDGAASTVKTVEEHTTDIAVIQTDISYIKSGIDELIQDKRRRHQ